MKRLLVLTMAVILVISMFSGCGKEIDNDSTVLSNQVFSVKVPEDWPEKIYVEYEADSIKIYQKAAFEAFGGGWLCSVEMYEDEVYLELPQYEVLKSEEATGITYVAQYPSDVQADVENEDSMNEYFKMFAQMPEIVKTFKLVD